MSKKESILSSVCLECAGLRVLLEEAHRRIGELEAQVRELTSRLNQNSSNSSRPPSSDPPWVGRYPRKPKSSRQAGGQPGHPGHYRQRFPPERIKEVIPYIPKVCAHCQTPLPQEPAPGDPEPTWHQVVELPPLAVTVTEHQGHARRCSSCGRLTRADIPEEVRAYTIGPRLAATASFFTGYCHLGKRTVQEIFHTLLEAKVSLGTISHYEQEMSSALAPIYEAVGDFVSWEPVKNVDETGWKKAGLLCWLWVAATTCAAFYQIQRERGEKGLQNLLGTIRGVVGSDRWGAYAKLPLAARQICWAHLKRDFQKFFDLGGTARQIGRAGRRAAKEIFAAWYALQSGSIDRPQFQVRLAPVRTRLEKALQRSRDGPEKKTARFCRNILRLYPALWTFLSVEGVEPTNNHAERLLRSGVLWRKRSFGNQSDNGCRFSERILTVVQTLRLQKRPVLDYLEHALTAARAGHPLPNLL